MVRVPGLSSRGPGQAQAGLPVEQMAPPRLSAPGWLFSASWYSQQTPLYQCSERGGLQPWGRQTATAGNQGSAEHSQIKLFL